MKELFRKIQPYSGKIFAVFLILFISFLIYSLSQAPVEGIDEKFKYLLEKHGYIILFVWGMLEGEAGLVMAGLLAHKEMMNLYL
ncbi:DedA family protein, partial [Aliarcobacter butzleri]